MMQSEINISIKDRAPSEYFSELIEHANDGKAAYGAITDYDQMKRNFRMHCIPDGMAGKDIEHYEDFLIERRILIANKIRDYYFKL